jgi:hypothetical protein
MQASVSKRKQSIPFEHKQWIAHQYSMISKEGTFWVELAQKAQTKFGIYYTPAKLRGQITHLIKKKEEISPSTMKENLPENKYHSAKRRDSISSVTQGSPSLTRTNSFDLPPYQIPLPHSLDIDHSFHWGSQDGELYGQISPDHALDDSMADPENVGSDVDDDLHVDLDSEEMQHNLNQQTAARDTLVPQPNLLDTANPQEVMDYLKDKLPSFSQKLEFIVTEDIDGEVFKGLTLEKLRQMNVSMGLSEKILKIVKPGIHHLFGLIT